jgi:MFS family permease
MTTAESAVARPPSPLASRPFRNLWFNNVAFFLVVNAQRFVFGWLVLDGLQRNEGIQGLVVFTLGLPTAFLVLQAGAWADRWDRRRMLIVTQVAGGAVMAGMALVIEAGVVNLSWVILATLLAGAASAVGSPVRSALVPMLVSREQLFGAIALNAIAITLSMIFGPVLAKLAGDRFGFEGAYWFQAILMFIGVLFLLRLKVPPHEEVRERRSVVAETRTAVRHVLDDRHLTTLFGLLLTSSLTVNPAILVTLQAHMKDRIGGDAGQAALPLALMGVGIAITSFVLLRRGDMENKGAVFQRALMVGSTITLLMGLTTALPQVLVLSFVMGLSGGLFINMNQGLVQANTPQELMGRVMGLYVLVNMGLMPFGALGLGMLASWFGPGPVISLAGLVSLVIVVATYVRNSELRRLG